MLRQQTAIIGALDTDEHARTIIALLLIHTTIGAAVGIATVA